MWVCLFVVTIWCVSLSLTLRRYRCVYDYTLSAVARVRVGSRGGGSRALYLRSIS